MRQQSEEEMRRGKKEDLMRVRKECARLEKARIGEEQMITLMDECGETIRSRGEHSSLFRALLFRSLTSPNLDTRYRTHDIGNLPTLPFKRIFTSHS